MLPDAGEEHTGGLAAESFGGSGSVGPDPYVEEWTVGDPAGVFAAPVPLPDPVDPSKVHTLFTVRLLTRGVQSA